MALLDIKELSTGYGDLQILRNINIEIEKGEIVALLGSNGAGKTTLMRTIVGLNRIWKGDVFMDGQRLTNASSTKIVSSGVSIVPEGRRLFAGMTVTENLEMGAYCNRKNIKEKIERIFDFMPRLRERKNHLAGDLSGGEQQMCAIGRALMNEPKILLIDEFSLGLAPTIVDSLVEIVHRINQEGVSVFIVEQDVQLVLDMSVRAYVMEIGEITLSGASKDLMNDPKVKEAYLGM
ncbi:MAG: ABC transporter ATP-binding protein [Thermodesulfovibrionales bacterium]|nr:ABC transporter ATP-binding protein [Thermodesulfovibrionales bacterium]